MTKSLIIAIDGHAGSGKSTVSRIISERVGIPHLDTGAFYRTAALAVLDAGVDPHDVIRVVEIADAMDFTVNGDIHLDGKDVTQTIRTQLVSDHVSTVAAHPEVRTRMVEAQRRWVGERGGSCVAEGRDIGTVVFPDADVKVFLDAHPEIRAARRAGEMDDSIAGADLERRDHLDSNRSFSPTTVADDALVIDTTDLTIDEVVDRIIEHMG